MSSCDRRARVIKDYVVQYSEPIQLREGQVVRLGREDDEYPGWWWCTATDGNAAWVPGDLLRRRETDADVLEDYDSTELAVRRDEDVQVTRALAAWLWVRNAAGESGWIPTSCVTFD